MRCHKCNSTELVFVESRADSSVVGGFVRIYECAECLAIVEDVPAEVCDAADREDGED